MNDATQPTTTAWQEGDGIRPRLRPDGFPTRNDLRYYNKAEHAIRAAMLAVEESGASVVLTDAVALLKKPVVIEAVRWLGPDEHSVQAILDWGCEVEPGGPEAWDQWEAPLWPLFIPTLEGRMRCNVGHWIVRGIAGAFYPVASDIFEATYERVDD